MLDGATPGHAERFNINAKTGQITVSASAKLDRDADGATTTYNVKVKATDGDRSDTEIDVAIHLLAVDEPPKITPGALEMSHWESDRDNKNRTAIDINLDNGYDTSVPDQAATYAATDMEDDIESLKWSLAGADGDLFTIDAGAADGVQPVGETATLAFRKGPDFENPGDANKDNVYQVILVVTDSGDNDERVAGVTVQGRGQLRRQQARRSEAVEPPAGD